MKTKAQFKQMSMTASVAIGVFTAVLLMILSSMVIAAMILNDGIQENKTGIITKIILAISAFAGVKISTTLQNNSRYIVAGIYTGVVSVLLLMGGVCFKIEVVNIMLNMLFVLCGSCVGMLLGNKKVKKHAYSKKRYR